MSRTHEDWVALAQQTKFAGFLQNWIQECKGLEDFSQTNHEQVRATLQHGSDFWHQANPHMLRDPHAEAAALDKLSIAIVSQAQGNVYQIPSAPSRLKQVSRHALGLNQRLALTPWDYVIGGLYGYDILTNWLGMSFLFSQGAGKDADILVKLVAYIVMVILSVLISLMEHAIARGVNAFIWILTRKNDTQFHMETGTRMMTLGATALMTIIGIAIMLWGYGTSASVVPEFFGESQSSWTMGWLIAIFISVSQWVHLVLRRANAVSAVSTRK